MKTKVTINRAPVLTLWAAVVAERFGYDHKTALTLGKAVAGLNAQAKGQRLGIFEKPKDRPLKLVRKAIGAKEPKGMEVVTLMGRAIPTVNTVEGTRAVLNDEKIDPKSVEKYLSQKFGDDLKDVQDAMRFLAKAYRLERLLIEAYDLYVRFRPTVPEGEKGWGAKGELDLNLIRSLTK